MNKYQKARGFLNKSILMILMSRFVHIKIETDTLIWNELATFLQIFQHKNNIYFLEEYDI